jgi:hypothetical protein
MAGSPGSRRSRHASVGELKAAARRGPHEGKADGESDVLAKIAETPVRFLVERDPTSAHCEMEAHLAPGNG